MFLISRTFSRQHPFPLFGKRPAIASNVPSEVPATVTETLVYENSGLSTLTATIGDGEQGWYKVVVAGAGHKNGSGSYYGRGAKATYNVYFCPNTELSFWGASNDGLYGGPDALTRATYGGSGLPYSINTNSQAGGGAGARTGSSAGGGGAGLVAMLKYNSETSYNCGTPVVKQTMLGYSQCPSFVYLDANGDPITLTTAPSLDSDLGYAYTGYIPDPSSTTGGTIAVIGFLEDEPVPYVGQQVKVYYLDDQTVPFYVTTVAEAPKESVYCKTCHGNLVMQGYSVFNTTGTRIAYIAAVTQNFRNRTVIVVQYSGRQESYMYDPNARPSFSRQIYYGWERASSGHAGTVQKQIFWTNSATPSLSGQNGVFMYEKVKDKMCISTAFANTANATRRPDLDTVSDTVAFGVTSDYQFISDVYGGANRTKGTGAYFWLLCGGAGYWDASSNHWNAGCAFGSVIQQAQSGQTGGYDYSTALGPADSFGATAGKDGADVVVDCNDAIAYDNVDAVSTAGWLNFHGANTTSTGFVQVYKLGDSTDVTKYAQKIYFPASDMAYIADLKLNDVFVETITIPKSINTVERFLQDVKQGDVVQITLHGDNGSVEDYVYDITSETIAFGLILGSAPWKIREYKERGDHKLGFSAGNYGCILISGGGAGGGISAAGTSAPTNYGGRGGTSLVRTFDFTNDTTQVGVIHVGKRGEAASGVGGTGYAAGSRRDGTSGGQGGEPTMITFNQVVTVENMPLTLYSFTNGSTIMYTLNSYPSTNGKLVQFCDAQGVPNGKTGYKSYDGTSYGITCQQDGLFYVDRGGSGNANIKTLYTGETRCIFNEATGGGGGAGGNSQNWRYGSGGAGGGGGGTYRVDMYNRDFYVIDGGAGSSPNGTNSGTTGGPGQLVDGEPPIDITDFTPAISPVSGFRGQNGVNSTGGNGGSGYGAGGGDGGRGNQNESNAFCGAGGGGAPGNWTGGWGGRNNGSSYQDNIAHTRNWPFGRAVEYGRGGNGYRQNDPLSWYLGTDGYAYIYRYESITGAIDCGGITSGASGDWERATPTTVNDPNYRFPQSTYQKCTVYSPTSQKWYCYCTVSGTGVCVTTADVPSDITDAPQFGALTAVTVTNATIGQYIYDAIVFNDTILVLGPGQVFTAPLNSPETLTRVFFDITDWVKIRTNGTDLFMWVGSYVYKASDPSGPWTWYATNISFPNTVQITWDGEKFVCVQSANGGVYTSDDGISWTQASTQDFVNEPIFVGAFDGTYTVVDAAGCVWTSSNLTSWTKETTGIGSTSNKTTAGTDGTSIVYVHPSGANGIAESFYLQQSIEPVTETIDCGSVIDTDITETIDNGVI